MRRFFRLQNFYGGSGLAVERIAGIMHLLKDTSLLLLFPVQMFIALSNAQASILRGNAVSGGVSQSITRTRGIVAVNGFEIILR